MYQEKAKAIADPTRIPSTTRSDATTIVI